MHIRPRNTQHALCTQLAAPRLPRRNEEQLFLCELVHARQLLRRFLRFARPPGCPCVRQASSVCDVLGDGQRAVDIGLLACFVEDGLAGVINKRYTIELVDETLRSCVELRCAGIVPPIPVLVVVVPEPAVCVKAVRDFMADDDADGAVSEIAGCAGVVEGWLRYACGDVDVVLVGEVSGVGDVGVNAVF